MHDTKAAEDLFGHPEDSEIADKIKSARDKFELIKIIDNRIDMRLAEVKSWYRQVREFTETGFLDQVPSRPTLMSRESAKFIRQMVNDELDELDESVEQVYDGYHYAEECIPYVNQADALLDAIYYLMDTAVRHGYDLDPLFKIVQKANMAKFADGVNMRDDGKILKPSDWQPPEPELMAEMRRQLKGRQDE
jgi:predicted HAD superfamily Cof-like phosphohydrolase